MIKVGSPYRLDSSIIARIEEMISQGPAEPGKFLTQESVFIYTTVEPRYNDVSRDWQNYVVVSRYRFKRVPDITILEKNNKNYRYIGG